MTASPVAPSSLPAGGPEMARDLQGLTARLLDAARAAGAESADALAVAGDSLSIEVRGGALEEAQRPRGSISACGC